MRNLGLGLSALLLSGCSAGELWLGDEPAAVTRSEQEGGGACAVTPEHTDGWGHIRHWQEAVHVRADGSDTTGDGSLDKPYATLDKAIGRYLLPPGQRDDRGAPGQGDEPKAGDSVYIAVGPGTYASSISIEEQGFVPDLHVEGCSSGEVVLEAADPLAPIWGVKGQTASLAGVSAVGGRNALLVGADAKATLRSVSVRESTRVGVLVTPGGALEMIDSEVITTRPDEKGEFGWGIALNGATGLLDGVLVSDSTGLGVFTDKSELTLTDSRIELTYPTSRSTLGRGLHMQNDSGATVTNSIFLGNHDAGVFGIFMRYIVMDGIIIDITGAGLVNSPLRDGIIIDITGAGIVFDPKKMAGDGLVLVGKQADKFDAFLDHNTINASKRAAILLENVEAELNGTVASADNGYAVDGQYLLGQGGTQVSGDDTDMVRHLGAAEQLPLNRRVLPLP